MQITYVAHENNYRSNHKSKIKSNQIINNQQKTNVKKEKKQKHTAHTDTHRLPSIFKIKTKTIVTVYKTFVIVVINICRLELVYAFHTFVDKQNNIITVTSLTHTTYHTQFSQK